MAKRKTRAVVPQDMQDAVGVLSLSDREQMFVEQYFLCGLNGTEAALATWNTTTRNSAAAMASQELSKPHVRAAVNARLDEYHMGANEVLARIANDARGTMEDFVDPDSGTIDLKKAASAKALGLIKRYKTRFITTTRTIAKGTTEEVETVETEIELYDGQSARRDLAKHLGLLTERSLNVNVDLSALTDEELDLVRSGKQLPPRVVIERGAK